VDRSTAVRDIAVRAGAYGMLGFVIDGNDVLDVYESVHSVAEEIRGGARPVLIEAKTYRPGSWSSYDRQSGYQSQQEILRWRAKDPLVRFAEQLQLLGIADTEMLRVLDERAAQEAAGAIEYAQESAYPEESELYDDVFAAS
jgi:TPP-dependent pyruvate/acetoin dehydrogenase alpha subunit